MTTVKCSTLTDPDMLIELNVVPLERIEPEFDEILRVFVDRTGLSRGIGELGRTDNVD